MAYNNYENMINRHAFRALDLPPIYPRECMAVGDDETHDDIPILIFREQHQPLSTPELTGAEWEKFEDDLATGSGIALSIEDFDTTNFNVGSPY